MAKKKTERTGTPPRRVDWSSTVDFTCVLMGTYGKYTAAICRATGLTPCQVTYRLHKAKVRRNDYWRDEPGTVVAAVTGDIFEWTRAHSSAALREVLGVGKEKKR